MGTPLLAPSPEEKVIIDPLLKCFDENFEFLKRSHETLVRTITDSAKLKPLIHSIRARIKDRSHLEDKLVRLMRKRTEGHNAFEVTPQNFHTKVNDLAGIRILHLHTIQAKEIHTHLHQLLTDCGYSFLEGPEARTWDIEYEAFFKKMGFETKRSETLYTSVHYVIHDKIPKLEMTCELQVRTLTEETWGEIDHAINYPHPTSSVPLREQIRALARATSTAGRLADAIYATLADETLRGIVNSLGQQSEEIVKKQRSSTVENVPTAKTKAARPLRKAKLKSDKLVVPRKNEKEK